MSGIADREAGSAGKVWPRSPLEASREHLQAVNSQKGRGLGAQPSLQGQSCHQRHVMLTAGPTAGMQAGAQCLAPCLLVESIFRSEDGWPPMKTNLRTLLPPGSQGRGKHRDSPLACHA